ncbi:MAG: RpiB/LacA/LacB family sugar-phosphate isomerase [Candidatus Babeliales bacterium]
MKISIGADHRGYNVKQAIMAEFNDIDWIDVGTDSSERTDYPLFAELVCQKILTKEVEAGILICGSGIGMSIAANRHKGIYAGLCWNPEVARVAKQDDGVNVLVVAADFVDQDTVFAIIRGWCRTEIKDGVYRQRLAMMDKT